MPTHADFFFLISTMEKLAADILKNKLHETVVNDRMFLDKETKHELEEKIKREVALFIKTYSGKGPKNINVFISGNQIEIKANETLTLFEITLISNNNNNSLVEYNRKLFYEENIGLLEKTIADIIYTNVHLREINIDSRRNTDTIVFYFD